MFLPSNVTPSLFTVGNIINFTSDNGSCHSKIKKKERTSLKGNREHIITWYFTEGPCTVSKLVKPYCVVIVRVFTSPWRSLLIFRTVTGGWRPHCTCKTSSVGITHQQLTFSQTFTTEKIKTPIKFLNWRHRLYKDSIRTLKEIWCLLFSILYLSLFQPYIR